MVRLHGFWLPLALLIQACAPARPPARPPAQPTHRNATQRNAPPAAPPPCASPAARPFAMHQYFFVFLRRGPAWTAAETPEVKRVGEGHMANIKRQFSAGKMVLAGPFEVPEGSPGGAYAGIFVLDVASREEAIAITEQDPAVKAGRFVVEILQWYGPAGLTFDGAEHPPAQK